MDAAVARIATRHHALLTREQAPWAYPSFRLAMELDGFRWHAGGRRFRSDRMRRNRVEAAGWRLLEAAPEDADDLVAGAAVIVRRAA